MNRRQLLTLAVVALPAAALVKFTPLERLPVDLKALGKLFRAAPGGTILVSADEGLKALGKLFRAAPGGTILVSADEGKTWSTHTRFGPDFDITNLGLDRQNRVTARMVYQGHPFHISLAANGKTWLTA
jgi:hypothetical protein